MSERRLTAIDLFCGAGGLSQGLADAGFEVLWGIDVEEHTKPTFEANHDCEMTVGDIRTTDPPDLGLETGELDLLAGGPPCPTFSRVGRSKINSLDCQHVQDDDRHLLYEEFLRYLEHYQPRAFLMENVQGMRSAENEAGDPVVEVIQAQMRGDRPVAGDALDVDYQVSVQLLDAADFGVPQRRKRLFFIGTRLDAEPPDMNAHWATHREPDSDDERGITYRHNPAGRTDPAQQPVDGFGEEQEPVSFPEFSREIASRDPWNTVADGILDLPPVSPDGETPPKKAEEYQIGPVSEYQHWVRDLDPDQDWAEQPLRNHECRGHNMRDLTLYKLLGEGTSYIIGDIPEEHQPYRTDIFYDKLKKQNPREPASTIVAHLHKDGHMFIHPSEARSFTVREAARLQSFRDTFEFPASRTQAFKQIGNAVPPLLAQALGTAVRAEILDPAAADVSGPAAAED